MPTPITKENALSLLRSAQSQNAPIELVATGQDQQALYVLGFVDVAEEGDAFAVAVPGQVAVVFELEDAEFDHSDPSEAPPEHRARSQRLLQCAIGVQKAEWNVLVRIWKRPDEVTVH